MSLLRLLTAGKSLVGSKNDESRYHLSRPGALPRFGGKKNPFRATTRPEAAQSAAPAPACEQDEPVEAVGPLPSSESLAASEVSPVSPDASAAMPAAAAPIAPRARGGGALAQCASKLKSFFQMRRQEAAAPVVPRFSKPLVQGELSLERVRVVRNDLSDSDVEIVPARLLATPTLDRTAEGPLGKITGRLFGAGKI